jgi:competence protein ComEA
LPERYRYLMGLPLNVNRAGAEDLELLAGIGPRLAERIVDARDSNGPFSSVRDLLRVPGIGRALVGRIAGRVCFF